MLGAQGRSILGRFSRRCEGTMLGPPQERGDLAENQWATKKGTWTSRLHVQHRAVVGSYICGP